MGNGMETFIVIAAVGLAALGLGRRLIGLLRDAPGSECCSGCTGCGLQSAKPQGCHPDPPDAPTDSDPGT